MSERPELILDGIDFLQARNKLVEYFLPEDPKLEKDPYVQQQVQRLEEVMTFTSRQEFELRLESLHEEYSQQKEEEGREPDDGKIHYVAKSGLIIERLKTIEEVFECLRFFWEEKGPFDPESLMLLQQALKKPLWSDQWTFKWGVKPPIRISPNHPKKEIYERIDVGSYVEVVGLKSLDEGRSGEVIAFGIPPDRAFAVVWGLFAVFKTIDNWVFSEPIYNLDFAPRRIS